MAVLPPTITNFLLDPGMVGRTQTFLRERGQRGFEATALWIGRALDEVTGHAIVEVVPSQIARQDVLGQVSVEVPPEAISELLTMVPEDLYVLIRVHSHPGEAYHSATDDRNMLISHQGAISIVVPDFGSGPFDLGRCSVNRLDHSEGWVQLSRQDVLDRFTVL
jgi:proteasome lid subunit RPN8/RPN11